MDIIQQAQMIGRAIYNNDPADRRRIIAYNPVLARCLTSVTAAILIQQIKHWWESSQKQPFYKFRAGGQTRNGVWEPNTNELYRNGDSWLEELAFGRSEFDSAIQVIGTKITTGMKKQTILEDTDAQFNDAGEMLNADHLVVYWTDSARVTWWQLNEPLLYSVLGKIEMANQAYAELGITSKQGANSENLNYLEIQKNRITFNTEMNSKDELKDSSRSQNSEKNLNSEKRENDLLQESMQLGDRSTNNIRVKKVKIETDLKIQEDSVNHAESAKKAQRKYGEAEREKALAYVQALESERGQPFVHGTSQTKRVWKEVYAELLPLSPEIADIRNLYRAMRTDTFWRNQEILPIHLANKYQSWVHADRPMNGAARWNDGPSPTSKAVQPVASEIFF